MRSKWAAALSAALLLSAAGCSAADTAPSAVSGRTFRPMSVESGVADGPLSPVMLDVYERSIPAEVYSAE